MSSISSSSSFILVQNIPMAKKDNSTENNNNNSPSIRHKWQKKEIEIIDQITTFTPLPNPICCIIAVYTGLIQLQEIVRNEIITYGECSKQTLSAIERVTEMDLSKILFGDKNAIAPRDPETGEYGIPAHVYEVPRNYQLFKTLFAQAGSWLLELNVSHCAIDDIGVSIIAEYLPALQHLDLSGNWLISTIGLEDLERHMNSIASVYVVCSMIVC